MNFIDMKPPMVVASQPIKAPPPSLERRIVVAYKYVIAVNSVDMREIV